jgi:RNA 2',3'-cyclic 3'-phosphodiesterase
MRLFVAIDLPTDVRVALANWISGNKPAAAGYKWVAAENLHVTLKFIGERPDIDIAPISQALGRTVFPAPIELEVSGVGSFPNVLFANVRAPETLSALARDIEQCLEPLGIAIEKRDFTPHLTLARRKEGARFPRDVGAHEKFGQFAADEFILYQSVLGAKGSTYTPLRRFRCLKP